jgi:hypothetical protein
MNERERLVTEQRGDKGNDGLAISVAQLTDKLV